MPATHPAVETPQFPGMVCPDCSATYVEGRRVCPNPACPSNPDLSDALRARLVERTAAYRAEVVARRKAMARYARALRS